RMRPATSSERRHQSAPPGRPPRVGEPRSAPLRPDESAARGNDQREKGLGRRIAPGSGRRPVVPEGKYEATGRKARALSTDGDEPRRTEGTAIAQVATTLPRDNRGTIPGKDSPRCRWP